MLPPETSEHHLSSPENLELYGTEISCFYDCNNYSSLQIKLWGTCPLKVSVL